MSPSDPSAMLSPTVANGLPVGVGMAKNWAGCGEAFTLQPVGDGDGDGLAATVRTTGVIVPLIGSVVVALIVVCARFGLPSYESVDCVGPLGGGPVKLDGDNVVE